MPILGKIAFHCFYDAIVNNARFLCVIVNNALSEFADDR